MATISKSYAVALTHQAVSHSATVKGPVLDVSTKLAVTLILAHASVEAVENTNPGKFLVLAAGAASGDEDWKIVGEFDATISTADTEAMIATEGAGETVLAVAATSGFVANDILYIQDTSVVADGEWGRCEKIVSNTSINLLHGLANAKDNADVIWNDADMFVWSCDVTSIGRIQVIFQHEGATGANCHVKAMAIYGDSIG